MKLLLVFLMIHLLVFHQYRKDQYEILAPKKDKPVKTILPAYKRDYLFRPGEVNTKDSLLFSYQKESLKDNFLNYPATIKKKYRW